MTRGLGAILDYEYMGPAVQVGKNLGTIMELTY